MIDARTMQLGDRGADGAPGRFGMAPSSSAALKGSASAIRCVIKSQR